jgi:hypothetical protein
VTAEKMNRSGTWWVEWLLFLLVLSGFANMAWRTVSDGYFPQPFFYDTSDTWRDWFSTVMWAHDGGEYDSWLSIYPPLSFVLLRTVSLPTCYAGLTDPEYIRTCDWLGIATFHAIYVINIFLTAAIFMRIDRRTALPRAFALTAGMPMLFGLERANIVLLCYTFILLAWGPLLKSARARWVFVGLAVNLKVYIIAGVMAQLLKRRWLWVEGCLLAIAAIWGVSYILNGSGTPLEVYNNIVNWATNKEANNVNNLWYSNTYEAVAYLLDQTQLPISLFLDSSQAEFARFFVSASTYLGQGLILIAAVAAWLRPEVVSQSRVTFLGLAMAMISSETSPYTQPILLFFVMQERWRGWLRPLAIGAAYLLCFPGDIALSPPALTVQYSFIGRTFVQTENALSATMLLRPFVFLLPGYFLSLVTIKDVWVDIWNEGWVTRNRFRLDLPVLRHMGRTQNPPTR